MKGVLLCRNSNCWPNALDQPECSGLPHRVSQLTDFAISKHQAAEVLISVREHAVKNFAVALIEMQDSRVSAFHGIVNCRNSFA